MADVMIGASYNGVTAKARLTVVPTAGTVNLESVTLDPDVIPYGGNVTGTVTLSSAAPSGGIVVTLGGSREGLATVPASVTVPQGATSATFTIDTEAPSDPRYVLVTATYDGLVRTALLTVIQGVE